MKRSDILVVDDEKDIRALICDALNDNSYVTREAFNSDQVLKRIDERVPDLIILDIWLQGSELDGLGVLEYVQKRYPYLPIIMISGHGTIETAVKSIKMGAYDYLEKPFTEDKLLILVKRACESSKLRKENVDLRSKVGELKEVIGESQKIKQLKTLIDKVAASQSRILIKGEPGTGKKLIAEMIYKKSKRSEEPFIVYDPVGMDENEASIELFGGNENQTNNNTARKVGLLELANNGTIFIKEVGDLPLSVQKKLLYFLQDQVLHRAENTNPVKLDVRFIASTNKDLTVLIEQGKFREDLYYRLNVVELNTPPLSERKDDIPLLADYYFTYFNRTMGLGYKRLSKEAIILMQSYSWPGNIRQLRNVIEWILIMSPKNEEVVKTDMLPPDIKSKTAPISNIQSDDNSKLMAMTLRDARELFESQYLKSQLERFNGNITQMANYIGMERSALHRKLKSLQIYNVAE
jgi:two-component system nitrogen regulation response regulator NtrX